MKTKWQILHDELFEIAQSQVEQVYDYRQLEEVGYPFVDFNESNWSATATKVGGAIKQFNFTLNVWTEIEDLTNLSNIAETIMNQAGHIAGFTILVNDSGLRYSIDRTVKPHVRRAMITLSFR